MMAVAGGIILAVIVLLFWRLIAVLFMWGVIAVVAAGLYFAFIHPLLS